ncbi:MAG TPA: condensation domain-containing protein, partial [Blastocatellia bacterium]|nr:condensation domain-containing protein [Blastocatellia bacterium]
MDKHNVEAIYPLSPIQQGIFFHSVDQPESEAYFIQQYWTLDQRDVDVRALKRAWQLAVDRHGILRTAFIWEYSGDPIQVVRRQVDLPWEELDWRGLPAEAGNRRLEELLAADRLRGFDLSKAPLTRLAFIHASESASILLWSYHHLLLDGWSVSILMSEVFATYDAIKHHKQIELPEPRSYRDYVMWSRGKDLSEAELFWRENLKGFSTPTPLGMGLQTGGSSPKDPKEGGYAKQKLEVSESTTAALHLMSRKNGLTLNTILQGVFALLLGRLSGHSDVVFGTSVSGRSPDLAGSESMLGVFINTLPTRVRI